MLHTGQIKLSGSMHPPYFVIDDFFSASEYFMLKDRVLNQDWQFVPTIAGDIFADQHGGHRVDHSGFGQTWYVVNKPEKNKNEDLFPIIRHKLHEQFEVDEVYRIRCGLHVPVGRTIVNDAHVDMVEPHWTGLIYFCTEADAGYTYLYDEYYDPCLYPDTISQIKGRELKVLDKIAPKENRIVFFRGDMYHSGGPPEKILRRCVMNINFLGWPRNVQVPNTNK